MVVFGKQADDKINKIMAEAIERVNENTRRLRVVEQRLKALDTRINSLEQTVLSKTKSDQKIIIDLNNNILSKEKEITELQNSIKEIVKQFKLLATKSDVGAIKGLIDIYNPIRSKFVTKEEVEKLIENKISGR